MNPIFLRRKRKVWIKPENESLPLQAVATISKNIEALGFTLSTELIERLQTIPQSRLDSFYKMLVKTLRNMVGVHRPFKPMYPNFPKQVMEATAAELYLNAMRHYFTHELPEYEHQPREPLTEQTNLHVIEFGEIDEFERIMTQLVGSSTSLSPEDVEDVRWFIRQYGDDVQRMLPAKCPFKENLAIVGAELLVKTTFGVDWVNQSIQTVTDVLRLTVALCDGDVSLATACKFKSFPRRTRRQLLALIDAAPNATEDMLRNGEPWKRLGERLHPGDHSEKFPRAYAAFQAVRNRASVETFASDVEAALEGGDVCQAIGILKQRPGELARRLDCLCRLNPDSQPVVDAFAAVAAQVSTPVLLQAMTHFSHRDEPSELRVFFPKGQIGNVFAIPNELLPLTAGTSQQLVTICRQALLSRFSTLPPLGKCFLDPHLENYLVPFSQRSASKSLRTLVRGSRLPMPTADVVRFFVWWKNGRDSVDIDLSAVLYDQNYKYVDAVTYYNLKNFGGHHSGDIVDAPQGAAEFIDLSIDACLKAGVRYVVGSLFSFSSQPFCDLPECFAGWMGRQEPNSGEIFEPKTVQDKVDIASNTRICLPMIMDFVTREVIWADITLQKGPLWNNVQTNLAGVSLMLRAITSMKKTNLHTLFGLHVESRGTATSERADAETVFAVDTGITPFDLDIIGSDFMS